MINNYTWRPLAALIFCAVFWQTARGQSTVPDTSFYAAALKNNQQLYASGTGYQSRLVNGRQYFYYERLYKGDAYYMGYEWRPADISYDGVTYTNVPALYDVYKDVLVVQLPDKQDNYSLSGAKLAQFTLLGHTFIRIDADTINADFKPGFYDLLYLGKSLALAKTVKTLQNTGTKITDKSFVEEKTYYLKYNGIYYEAGSEGAALRVFKDKKKELQQYIKSSGIKFRRDPEQALVKIAAYYDHLTDKL